MKIKGKFIFTISLLIILVGCFYIKKTLIYPKNKLTVLKPESSYKEVILKFGKPTQIVIPFFSAGTTDFENNFINITYNEFNRDRYIEYQLTFNSLYRLRRIMMRDTLLNTGSIDVYFDNRKPSLFSRKSIKLEDDFEKIEIGASYSDVIAKFSKPDIEDLQEKSIIYFVDETECYKLYFSKSLRLRQLDVYTDYVVKGDKYLEGERNILFYDSRIY